MDIQIIIKAPNQNVADHAVHCNMNWTVEKLKNHLSHSYPNRPAVEDQKLIYSGRLLFNHLHLKDFLRPDEDQSSIYILHLVCNEYYSAPRRQRPPSSHHRNHRQQSNRRVTNEAAPRQSSENTVRHRNTNPTQPSNNFYPQVSSVLTPPASAPFFQPDAVIAAQYAAMQQMYAYYFSQYVQSINTDPIQNAFTSAGTGAFPNPQPQFGYHEVPAPPAVNQVNNVAGPLFLDEFDPGIFRDWLENAFHLCRFFILFCIIYFYSSPERMILVIICTFFVFLYQEGYFVRWLNPAVPVDANGPQEAHEDVDAPVEFENNEIEALLVDEDNNVNAEVHDESELEAAMDGDAPPHDQHPDVVNNNHIFSPLTFIQTFFSSLIPEPPPPVNIN
ncbi:homocysteine-responsive endoplasmic reticulum-resident ubiquitin-like domain member 2 protein [Caerostris darwini]|uniref:Homocysteine-responsive endoplasmic reticulum-resident ubiquitin-like domain member 2 protein n=1 Tax=Caerostris darwini TaxID=1538125 RepID=A0AAV4TGS2_9ARAC|nr:homocysteine-responsive endoplasmic reticulum-resident ubiquitin-like domain member 2 protein [Caerostris darwini]